MPPIQQRLKNTRAFPGGTEYALELGVAGARERVPAILLVPESDVRVPAALLLHGYSSRKEMMSESAGRGLLGFGIASLAIDLPMHGERGNPLQAQASRNPLELMRQWKLGLDECSLALRYLAMRPEIDGDRLAIVGYSLGSFLGVVAAAQETSVRAVVLAAGGDLPAGTPLNRIARTVADPIKAVRKLKGVPLLMLNGKHDRTIKAEQATRLFAAAGEPKEIRWWDSAHHLPEQTVTEAAEWLAGRLGARTSPPSARPRGNRGAVR